MLHSWFENMRTEACDFTLRLFKRLLSSPILQGICLLKQGDRFNLSSRDETPAHDFRRGFKAFEPKRFGGLESAGLSRVFQDHGAGRSARPRQCRAAVGFGDGLW